MKRIETIVADHPRVCVDLSPAAAAVRGQLASIGFVPCDAPCADTDWLVTDHDGAVAGDGVPVLRLTGKTSIYALKQAVIALFSQPGT